MFEISISNIKKYCYMFIFCVPVGSESLLKMAIVEKYLPMFYKCSSIDLVAIQYKIGTIVVGNALLFRSTYQSFCSCSRQMRVKLS